nr:zinc-binding dehydrogenase [Actinomycetota bacterium]
VSTIQASRDQSLLESLSTLDDPPRIVYECTGVAAGIDAAVGSVERGGRVVVVGLHKAPVPVNLTAVALQEKEVIGTLAHVFGADFGDALDLLEDETDLWALVAPAVIPLADLVEVGLRPMVDGGTAPIKALLDPRIDVARPIQTG